MVVLLKFVFALAVLRAQAVEWVLHDIFDA